jgi:hypothetical protein
MQIVFGIFGLVLAVVVLLASIAGLLMVCRKQQL